MSHASPLLLPRIPKPAETALVRSTHAADCRLITWVSANTCAEWESFSGFAGFSARSRPRPAYLQVALPDTREARRSASHGALPLYRGVPYSQFLRFSHPSQSHRPIQPRYLLRHRINRLPRHVRSVANGPKTLQSRSEPIRWNFLAVVTVTFCCPRAR
jgi:hypothetical protein